MAPPRRNEDRRVPPPSSALSTYSDASSSYWPPGWSFDRFVRATSEDNLALPDDERAKMQAGLRDVLGEDGIHEMVRVVWQEQLRRKKLEEQEAAAASSTPVAREPLPTPDWLKPWGKYYRGQAWGFVAFRTAAATAAMTTGSSTVEQFERLVQEIVEIPFDAALEEGHSAEEIAEARKTFEIRWVEVEDEGQQGEDGKEAEQTQSEGASVEKLRAQYRTLRDSGDLPSGLTLPLFLSVSPEAVKSILATLPSGEASGSKPTTASLRWRAEAPFLLAVPAEDARGPVDDDEEAGDSTQDGERSWFKPAFRVAAEVLVDELWWIVERQIIALHRLLRFVREATLSDDLPAARTEQSAHVPGNDDDGRDKEPDRDDDGLDAIWWSVHAPPHRMRKRRRLLQTNDG